MRNYVLLLAGICLVPAFAQAQAQAAATTKPQPPASAASKPATPPAERKEVKLSEKVLKTYVGEYQMGPDRTLTLTLENGSLWGQPTDQQKRQMFAETPAKFFLKDLDVQMVFQKDAKGNVTGMVMDQAGRPQRELKKIK
jgi:hypothetical protein